MSTLTKNALIIDSPERQGTVRRIVQGGLTMTLWLAWLYLLLPIFEPALAMLGVDLQAMGLGVKAIEVEPFAMALLLVGTVMVSFWLWARYNVLLHRFRSSVQSESDGVGHNELADSFGICPQALVGWQRSEQLVIRHTEQGGICSVETGYPLAIQPSANEPQLRDDGMNDDMLTISRAS